MKISFPRAHVVLACAAIAALLPSCSGGDPVAGASGQAPAVASTAASNPKFAPALTGFYTVLRTAPADGATVSGVVRLEFWGNSIRNAEVLPEAGYEPKYGRFNINQSGSDAWIDLDTTKLPNGPLRVRVSAFDSEAGQPGREQVAMSVRTWNVNNPVAPGPLTVTSVSAPPDGAVLSGTTRLEVRGTGLANVELVAAPGYAPKFGIFNISGDRTRAWLDFDTRTMQDTSIGLRIRAFDNTAGQPANEIVAMMGRGWTFRNGLTPFEARLTQGPAHGAIVSGNYLYLRVDGYDIRNVELLPETGYSPKFGVFEVFSDGTGAVLGVDIRTLPKGPFTARVSAFNRPAGAADAQEIVVMPARTWVIQ